MRQSKNNLFSYKFISSSTVGRSNFIFCKCIGHMIKWVLDNISYDHDPKVKDKGQIMYFLVNVSPLKLLYEAISNITGG